jgi:hypothetical protein
MQEELERRPQDVQKIRITLQIKLGLHHQKDQRKKYLNFDQLIVLLNHQQE